MISSIVSMLFGAVRFISCSQSFSLRPSLFIAIDHSSGSIGGMPAVCIASMRTVAASRGCPASSNSGKKSETGAFKSSLPSQAKMQAHSAVIDLLIEAMPNRVSLSTGCREAPSRQP